MTDLDEPHTSPWNVSFRERAAQIRRIAELEDTVARMTAAHEDEVRSLTDAAVVLAGELGEYAVRAERARQIILRFGYGDPINGRVLDALNGEDR